MHQICFLPAIEVEIKIKGLSVSKTCLRLKLSVLSLFYVIERGRYLIAE